VQGTQMICWIGSDYIPNYRSSFLIVFIDFAQDIVKRRRLKLISIIDALSKGCEAIPSLVNVQITSK